jgi:hypothetical protein
MSVSGITKPKNKGREASAIVNIRHSKELLILDKFYSYQKAAMGFIHVIEGM